MGVLCSLCEPTHYLQFGQCLECPTNTASAWAFMVGAAAVASLLLVAAVAVREYLPQTVMKIGLAMLQIVGNANTAFAAPWPSQFVELATGMKVFMLELLTLTRTSCTTPVTFYTAFNVNVVGLTVVSAVVAAGAFVSSRYRRQRLSAGTILKPLFMLWLLCYPAVSLNLFQLLNLM